MDNSAVTLSIGDGVTWLRIIRIGDDRRPEPEARCAI